jgi:hypothetical protein
LAPLLLPRLRGTGTAFEGLPLPAAPTAGAAASSQLSSLLPAAPDSCAACLLDLLAVAHLPLPSSLGAFCTPWLPSFDQSLPSSSLVSEPGASAALPCVLRLRLGAALPLAGADLR